MNANFGLLEELPDPPRDKAKKRELYAERALAVMQEWYGQLPRSGSVNLRDAKSNDPQAG